MIKKKKSNEVRKIVEKRNFFLKYGLLIGLALFLIDFVVLFFLKNYSGLSFFANVMSIIIAAGVAFIAFFFYLRLPKKFQIEKNTFLILFIAFAIRLLGEVLWAYYDLLAKIMPPFSFADVMWVLSNFIILFALEYKLRKTVMPHRRMAIIVFSLILFLLSAFFIWGIYLRLLDLETGAWFAYLVNESYVLFDLFILILMVTPLYVSIIRKNQCFLFYFFMALGFIAFIIYDFLFASMVLEETYSSGGRIEILYFLSYFLIYCAFYFKYNCVECCFKK